MKKKIIVADNDALLSQTIDMCLSKRGYEVRAVSTGVDAVKCLFKEKPDLMVLELALPDCNGWFLARLLAKLELERRPPIILTSVLDPDRGKMAEARPYAYIQKPFDMRQLIDAVESGLRDQEMSALYAGNRC